MVSTRPARSSPLESDERELELDIDVHPDLLKLRPGDLITAAGGRWRITSQSFRESPTGQLRVSVVIRSEPPDAEAETRRASAREADRQRRQRPSRLEDIGDGFAPEVRAKQLHAEELIERLYTDFADYLHRSPFRLVEQANETLTEYTQRIVFSEPPPVLRWSQQVGDILSNLEAALDYLMWHVAQIELGVDEPQQPRRIYFPICEGPKAFRDWQRQLPWQLSGHVAERIEQWQPYKCSSAISPARFLSRAGNQNKHRMLLDIGVGTFSGTLSSTLPTASEPTWHRPLRRVIHDGDVMTSVTFPAPVPGVCISHRYQLTLVTRPPANVVSPALGEWIRLTDVLTAVRQYVLFAVHEVYHDLRLGPRTTQRTRTT